MNSLESINFKGSKMKKLKTLVTSAIVLVMLMGMAATANAWTLFLPIQGFHKNVERALLREKYEEPQEAKEYWAKAAELGEELLESNAERTSYLIGTARAYYGLGEYEKSIGLYEKIIEIKKAQKVEDIAADYPWVYVYLGLANAKLGNNADAVKYWKQVPQKIGPVYNSIQEQIGVLEGKQTAAVQ